MTAVETAALPCQLATGCINDQGYAMVRIKGKLHYRHRLAYESAKGPIPDGLVVDHICHNADEACLGGPCVHRRCVEPSHLEAVPHRTNSLRGRGMAPARAAQTHCIHGHEYTPENTYVRPSGGGRRNCRVCIRARTQQTLLRQKGVAL